MFRNLALMGMQENTLLYKTDKNKEKQQVGIKGPKFSDMCVCVCVCVFIYFVFPASNHCCDLKKMGSFI